MTILSQLRVKNLTLNLRLLSKTFQFKVSLPLIFSMMIAVILCSRIINHLLINHEALFLSSLGFLMIFLSIYIIKFFKDVLEDKKLAIFLFLGVIIGFALQELNISSGHFELWVEDGYLMYRNSLISFDFSSITPEIIENILSSSLVDCDKYYPSFQFLLWGDKTPNQAIEASLLETQGEA